MIIAGRRVCFVSLLLFAVLLGCSSGKDTSGSTRITVPVTQVFDGDTIEVELKSETESVRLLLVDTPETSHPRLGVQPFGPEAKEFMKQLLSDAETVELEFDIGEKRDRYGRLLAYVYVNGTMLQEELVKSGMARVAYIFPPNVRHLDRLKKLERESKEAGRGVWSIENYAQDAGFHPKTVEKQKREKAGSTVPGCVIKGNVNSRGDRIYHTTDSPWYKETKPEQWFCTEEEAEAAGFRPPKQ